MVRLYETILSSTRTGRFDAIEVFKRIVNQATSKKALKSAKTDIDTLLVCFGVHNLKELEYEYSSMRELSTISVFSKKNCPVGRRLIMAINFSKDKFDGGRTYIMLSDLEHAQYFYSQNAVEGFLENRGFVRDATNSNTCFMIAPVEIQRMLW